jgi:hypothetical protein
MVSGPWGSGTTAVAGVLAHLGYTGFGPFLTITDPRFGNSYELMPFRDLVLRLASEEALRLKVTSVEPIHAELEGFKQEILAQRHGAYDPERSPPLFLKYPLAALIMPWLAEHFELRQVLVGRPLAHIEATRARRRWAPQFGGRGAQEIYPLLLTAMLDKAIPTLVVHHHELLRAPEPTIRDIARFGGHEGTSAQQREALQFIEQSAAWRDANASATTTH